MSINVLLMPLLAIVLAGPFYLACRQCTCLNVQEPSP
ncbi:hypothetical protein PCO31110_04599 [Pandoraea communis]|uniref:Uncharacterized protein n=1 Tax=Pandoraea communis TaxID=2508297 RepID=A0A5E4YJ93_9BURK|nr:hypothetical protein PCO31110_04599 [Pandoraea communis]